MNNDDLKNDKDLTREDKKLIRKARKNSLKLKKIRANMTDKEKRDIDQVLLASRKFKHSYSGCKCWGCNSSNFLPAKIIWSENN